MTCRIRILKRMDVVGWKLWKEENGKRIRDSLWVIPQSVKIPI